MSLNFRKFTYNFLNKCKCMEKITEINNKEGRRLALIAGRAALCAVNIHSISDAKKKEKSALYYPNVPPSPGAVLSVSIKAILQS